LPLIVTVWRKWRVAPLRACFRRESVRRLLRCEQGAEQMEYLLIVAAVVVPLVYAVRLMWAVLLHYFTVESLVIDLAFF
jgi:Flp pilus assembly pilin Flp